MAGDLGTALGSPCFSIPKAEMEEAPMVTELPERTYTQWMLTNHTLHQTQAQVNAAWKTWACEGFGA